MANIRKTTSIQSDDEFAREVDTIAGIEVGLATLLAKQDKTLQRVRERYAKAVNKMKNEQARRMGNVLCYATINRETLLGKGRKSAETALATWGWRTAPPALSLVKGRNWADVTAALRALGAPYSDMFLPYVPAPDKKRIKDEIASDLLAGLGLRNESKEGFYISAKDSSIEEL